MQVQISPTVDAIDYLIEDCAELELDVNLVSVSGNEIVLNGPAAETIKIDLATSNYSMLEKVLAGLKFNFSELPLLVTGESKEIRLLTPKISVAKLLPTVYSFTHNRYGSVRGTDDVRARFSSNIFRAMANNPGPYHLGTAFLGIIENETGPLMAERVVDASNLEIRVKRFHIGSPVHRYKYTEKYPTLAGPALDKWSRFDSPVVCFDWRHPLEDDNGNRLADEPISDDYAAVWVSDVARAKQLAREAFLWLETRFFESNLELIDICFFIDTSGSILFGEISPDCMRVRNISENNNYSLDKDQWRNGSSEEIVLAKYKELSDRVCANL